MIRNLFIALCAGGLFTMSGCTPSFHRGTVAMKIDNTEAHICLGRGEVTVGDTVWLLRNVCSPLALRKPRRQALACRMERVGEGEVTELLNEHYSVAKFPPGVDFKEGDIVERNGAR